MRIEPIGVIRTPFKCKTAMPIQPCFSKAGGRVEVFKEYSDGLKDIEGFSHIILIYRFHKAKGHCLVTKPFLDVKERGLFATRYPRRPNQIGISTVRLLKRKGNVLFADNIDILDGTPLLDIKPYVPDFEPQGKLRTGWYKGRISDNVRKK